MTSHRKKRVSVLKALTRRQWVRLGAGVAVIGMVVTAGIASRNYYIARNETPASELTSYSATQTGGLTVSRNSIRRAINEGQGGSDAGTSYVRVEINGASRLVLGEHFTTVKSVLDAGNITLDPSDTVTPKLSAKVSESTVIRIQRSDAKLRTVDSKIPYNTITKKTSDLPQGTVKVQTQGRVGIMEATYLLTVAGERSLSRNMIVNFVKTAPVDKVVLMGTGSNASDTSSSEDSSDSSDGQASSGGSAKDDDSKSSDKTPSDASSYGTTMPVGDAQSLAHAQAVARGWDEGEFSCLVQLWNRESGWRVNASNPSGAYGIPQALPGSKMGAGWQNDAGVQIRWGLGYIANHYGTPCGAWSHSNSSGWY